MGSVTGLRELTAGRWQGIAGAPPIARRTSVSELFHVDFVLLDPFIEDLAGDAKDGRYPCKVALLLFNDIDETFALIPKDSGRGSDPFFLHLFKIRDLKDP